MTTAARMNEDTTSVSGLSDNGLDAPVDMHALIYVVFRRLGVDSTVDYTPESKDFTKILRIPKWIIYGYKGGAEFFRKMDRGVTEGISSEEHPMILDQTYHLRPVQLTIIQSTDKIMEECKTVKRFCENPQYPECKDGELIGHDDDLELFQQYINYHDAKFKTSGTKGKYIEENYIEGIDVNAEAEAKMAGEAKTEAKAEAKTEAKMAGEAKTEAKTSNKKYVESKDAEKYVTDPFELKLLRDYLDKRVAENKQFTVVYESKNDAEVYAVWEKLINMNRILLLLEDYFGIENGITSKIYMFISCTIYMTPMNRLSEVSKDEYFNNFISQAVETWEIDNEENKEAIMKAIKDSEEILKREEAKNPERLAAAERAIEDAKRRLDEADRQAERDAAAAAPAQAAAAPAQDAEEHDDEDMD